MPRCLPSPAVSGTGRRWPDRGDSGQFLAKPRQPAAQLLQSGALISNALAQFLRMPAQGGDQIFAPEPVNDLSEVVGRRVDVFRLSGTCLHARLQIVEVDIDTV